jgi:DNA-binding NtrC family response regulator
MGATTKQQSGPDELERAAWRAVHSGIGLTRAVDMFRALCIEWALVASNGRKGAAARLLGIHRNTLRRDLETARRRNGKAA